MNENTSPHIRRAEFCPASHDLDAQRHLLQQGEVIYYHSRSKYPLQMDTYITFCHYILPLHSASAILQSVGNLATKTVMARTLSYGRTSVDCATLLT